MSFEVGPRGDLARVRWLSPDGMHLQLDYRNGQTATVDSDEPFTVDVGSVLLVRAEDHHLEVVEPDVWPEQHDVAVVRLKKGDVTIVDAGGRLRLLKTNSKIEYHEGNTVETSESDGIVRVLNEEPIRFLDLPAVDDAAINSFKTNTDSTSLTFGHFGGLREVVERARELIETPLEHHQQLATIGARPVKGVLFTGPPGTGKTMLARIIAARAGAVFYEISGPEIFSKWYGQSEEMLRRLFEDAAKQDQAIIFFDEIDSIAAQRDEDAHEASKRVVAQLLTLMDGFKPEHNVMVIAATNRPQDIDVALLRPGRFDWEIQFPLPSLLDRREILQVATHGLATVEPLPHAYVAERTEGWSGADLTAIWTEAALLAVLDDRSVLMTEDYLGGLERVTAQKNRVRHSEPGRGAR